VITFLLVKFLFLGVQQVKPLASKIPDLTDTDQAEHKFGTLQAYF
jgi:hypothetical protein